MGRLASARVAVEVLDLHSKRAAQIDEAVEIYGYDTWKVRQTAARDSRSRKEREAPVDLTRRWTRDLASIGWDVDLRQFYRWCQELGLELFEVRRAEIELYARQLEEHGRARATIGRRLSTIAGFYRYAAEEV